MVLKLNLRRFNQYIMIVLYDLLHHLFHVNIAGIYPQSAVSLVPYCTGGNNILISML